MDDWAKVQLYDVADLSGGFAFKSSQYTDAGRFVLRTVNIDDQFSITMENANFISEADAKEFERFALQEHDTLFVMVAATLGKIGYVRARDLPALLNQNMWVIRAKEGAIDPVFLHYLFRQISKIPLSWVGGSARSFLRRDDVRKLEFELPGSAEQERIAHTLKTLDDKIELNRRMNETLEEMARAVFRDWFVEFGPTRRQIDGATDPAAIMGHAFPPEKAATLAPLFPAKLGDDGLPEGWRERDLRSVLTLNYGKSLTKKARKPGPFNVFGSGGISGTHDTALAKGPSIIVGRKGTVGSLYWTREDFYAIDTVFYVTSDYPMVYCHRLLETLGLETMNTDAAVPGLNRDNAYRQEFAFGGDNLIHAYAEFVRTLTEKSDANQQENQTLAEMRDLLLPKLMSGEIRLKDAEGLVE